MSDKIEVGDRVRAPGKSEGGTVLAIDDLLIAKDRLDDRYWVKFDDGAYQTWWRPNLTRIEPEPVVLRPKYRVGERVRTNALRLNITPDMSYVISRPAVGYEVESGGWLPESLLEPVPEPCPECGK